MKLLEEKILAQGKALSRDILKVDSFLNHQVDPNLMKQLGEEFANYFKHKRITKVITIESSGIAPALMTALTLQVPLVILKKQNSKILKEDVYQTKVESFTKGTQYELTLSKKYLNSSDSVLIIDDFLANGEAISGAVRLVEMGGATISGVGIVIEKSFQPGREKVEKMNLDIYSLARIAHLEENIIEFLPN